MQATCCLDTDRCTPGTAPFTLHSHRQEALLLIMHWVCRAAKAPEAHCWARGLLTVMPTRHPASGLLLPAGWAGLQLPLDPGGA